MGKARHDFFLFPPGQYKLQKTFKCDDIFFLKATEIIGSSMFPLLSTWKTHHFMDLRHIHGTKVIHLN